LLGEALKKVLIEKGLCQEPVKDIITAFALVALSTSSHKIGCFISTSLGLGSNMIKSQVLGATTVSALPIVSFNDLLFEQPFSIRGGHSKKIETIVRRRFEHEVGAQWVSYFFFLGNPAFMLANAFGETVLLLLGRLLPAALRAFMLA
jgi:hypothetical protein